MLVRFQKFDISKVNLFKGFLRLSIFTTISAFAWFFFIETLKHHSIAFGISDQDARDLRKASNIIIDGNECIYREGKEYTDGVKIENKYKIDKLGNWISDEEKNQIIKKCTEYWNHFVRHELYECRASFACDDIIDRALKRIIKNESSIDYSTGYLVSNQKYGITRSSSTWVEDGEHKISVFYSPNGYSIVPSLGEKIKWCSKIAALWALLFFFCASVLLPLACYSLYYLILLPLKITAILVDYFIWVKQGFI